MLLIKFNADYADEFDVYGFAILSESTWEQEKESWSKFEYPFEWYFGTNEMIEFYNEDDVKSVFTEVEIDGDCALYLKEVFDMFRNRWGHFPVPSDHALTL